MGEKMPDSCDAALEEYNKRQLELADAWAVLVAMAAATAVSAILFLAAIAIAVAFLASVGTPAGVATWAMFAGLAGVAILAGAVTLFGFIALFSAYNGWRAAMDRRQTAYAAIYAKCPADRVPPPPI
jgi:hypothetical protein